jgi:hypothetical protein
MKIEGFALRSDQIKKQPRHRHRSFQHGKTELTTGFTLRRITHPSCSRMNLFLAFERM